MHTIIKGTKTVAEFKAVKEKMEKLTAKYYDRHKQAFENWSEGEPVNVWFDSDNNLCIEYESGNWWHYNENCEWW